MKILFLILLSVLVSSIGVVAQEEYVCLPCGQSCDKTIHMGLGSCSTCNMVLVKKATVKFKDITAQEFCKRIAENKDVVILDVRSAAEFSGSSTTMETYGHFKNAINIGIQELETRIDELSKYKNKEVLVYCSHSHRSPRASYLLDTKGFMNVKNLLGGVSTFVDSKNETWLKEKFVFHLD